MNTDAMSSGLHERARQMIALSGSESASTPELAHDDRVWLRSHLESCPPCREFAESAGRTIQALRNIPLTVSGGLVSTTQMRVHQRAQEMRRQRERLWMVCVCCAAVTTSTAVTTAMLWHGFEWIGRQTQLSAPVWEGSFVVFYLMPAVLVGILLLAQGTYLADHNGSSLD